MDIENIRVVPELTLDSKGSIKILSIVIPSYNSAKTLLICLEALEKQTASKGEFEVTVVDDGSVDETLEMLMHFKSRSNINLYWKTIQNSGPGNARNCGVACSTGLWIGFVDADVIRA